MEQLFMKVFERRDWVAAQVQEQADSYAQTLACTLLAAGHRPPDWLLPSRPGEPQQGAFPSPFASASFPRINNVNGVAYFLEKPIELNGKPIVPGLIFTGSQITTPAANRTFFFPPAIPSTAIRKPEVPNAYMQPVNNCAVLSTLADLDADQHEEPQHEQTSLSKELANTCAEPSMFSRIQRSKSRQRNIEGRSREKDQAANSGSCDGIQDGVKKTNLGTVGSNRTTLSSSSRSCGNVTNNAETSSACPDQENGFYASQGRSCDLKCHSDLGSRGKQLDCVPSLASEDKVICSDNNRSIGNLPIVPLPNHTKVNIADTMCHAMPSTHLLVEPKKLQFDGVESACVGTASEQTGQQHESALESDHFGLADRNLLSEGPYPTSSLQEPHSMGRSSLDDLKSDNSKSIDADVKHNQYGLEHGHHDLSAMHSLNEEPSQNCSAEAPGFLGDPVLRKNTHVPEASSLGRARSTVSRTQEMVMLNSDKINCSEISRSVVNPILDKDTLHTEDTKQPQSPNSNVSPVQLPTQLADSKFEANASSGRSMNSLSGEDECVHLSNLLTNGRNSSYSLGMSSVSKAQLPPQTPSDNVCQSSPLSYGTHNNGIHSNGSASADAFESVENVLPQDQYLLARPSLEFGGFIAEADAPLGHPPPDSHNEMVKGNPASELVNCHSGELGDDVHVNEAHYSSTENKKDQYLVPKVISSVSGRTRKMHETERSATSSDKCSGSLWQEGIEQETPVENDLPINAEAGITENVEHIKSSQHSLQSILRSSVSYEKSNQLQADKRNGRKGSVADGVQVNGGNSSKRKRVKCQDITFSNSSRTNSLSLNHQDGIGSHVATAENLSGRSRPSGCNLLRSSEFNELMCLKSEAKNTATKSKNSVASDALENGDTSPELKKHSHVSDVAICNSSCEEALSPNFNHSNGSRSAVERTDFQNSQPQFQNNFDMSAPSALPCCSSITPDIEVCYAKEENLCLEGQCLSVNVSSGEHQDMAIQADEMLYYSGTGPLTILPSHTLDQHVKQASDLVASANKKLSFESGVKHDTGCETEDSVRFLLSDATIPRQKGDESVDCNNEMPEFERFDVSLPFDSPATEKRTFEALCDSRRFGTLSSDISCKVNTVTGMHQLVAPMSKKATSFSFSGDVRQYSTSSDGSIADIFGACGFGISGSFLPSDDVASCSSNDSDKHMSGENPLTPAVEKYSLGKLSTRVGSVSEHMGSIPELSCFRIDEDSGIAEENEHQDVLPESIGNQDQSGRKALQDITGLCQNADNSALHSLGFVDTANTDLITETHVSKLNQNSGLRNDHNYKKPKEKSASLVKREGKFSRSLRNRLSKTEVTDNRNQRNTSDANIGKRSKPSNIVANVSSFIPLVKTKQQSTTACEGLHELDFSLAVKKDVRVKALEAAEAAKRLEEKKQNEREMRKAAAKLEREKIKQEKESKQKQEQEQKKKRDTDMATRKRQRDEEERREKERKRRCAEEARKQQKQPIERRHADDEKDAHPKASDNKELRKNLVEAVKGEVKPSETIDLGNKATTSNTDMVVDERPSSLGSHGTENIPNNLDESYVMTPYKDSDDEDEDEEASRRRKKLKPSWVREENLVNILLSDYHQALDPREIFAQKRSFNLSEVLPVHVPMRGFQ
ncbi:hypothetical protein EJB05_43426, partial [Eragrostis curvula]